MNNIDKKLLEQYYTKLKLLQYSYNSFSYKQRINEVFNNNTRKKRKKIKKKITNYKKLIYDLKISNIIQNIFYEENILTEKNINNKYFNNDLFNIINEYKIGDNYLYIKYIGNKYLKMVFNIDIIKEQLKNGEIEQIYEGKYNKNVNVIQTSNLMFDIKTMIYSKINIFNLKKKKEPILHLRFLNSNLKNDFMSFNIITNFDDFYKFEEELLNKNICEIMCSYFEFDNDSTIYTINSLFSIDNKLCNFKLYSDKFYEFELANYIYKRMNKYIN